MDKIVSKIVGLGVPGLVLFVALSATGYAGAAAITTALAAIGPFGILGGYSFFRNNCIIFPSNNRVWL